MDGAIGQLFAALDTDNSGDLTPQEMQFMGKAVLGTLPTPEAAKKEIEKAGGTKTLPKDAFVAFAKAGLAKVGDEGDVAAVIAVWIDRIKKSQAAEAAKK
jgi:hypothetical protein